MKRFLFMIVQSPFLQLCIIISALSHGEAWHTSRFWITSLLSKSQANKFPLPVLQPSKLPRIFLLLYFEPPTSRVTPVLIPSGSKRITLHLSTNHSAQNNIPGREHLLHLSTRYTQRANNPQPPKEY